jgi:hypothetical protein
LGPFACFLSTPDGVGKWFGVVVHQLARIVRRGLRRGRRYAAPIEQHRKGGCNGGFTPAAIDLLVPAQSARHGGQAFGAARAAAFDLALYEHTDSSHRRAVLESLLPLEQEHTLK